MRKEMLAHARVWNNAAVSLLHEAQVTDDSETELAMRAAATLAHYVAEGYDKESEK